MQPLASPPHSLPRHRVGRIWSSSRASSALGRTLSLLLLYIAVPDAAHAQATVATITGTTADVQGAVLPQVSITAHNTITGATRTILSDANGHYALTALPTGTYDVTYVRDGFAKVEVDGIVLTVGLEFRRDVAFAAGGIEQTVNVAGSQPLVDTSSAEGGTAVISESQIESLPIAGRQSTQLSLLLPGTTTDATRSVRPDANIGAGDGNIANSIYLVDGLTNMISGAGDPRDNIPEAAVQEFKVILTSPEAEYGGRDGGVVTLVTKSGGDNIHGEVFEFYRSHYVNRVDVYTQAQHDSDPTLYPIQPFSRNQFGGAVGGPILKNKLHYFGSFEELNDQEYFTVAPGGLANTTALKAVATDYAALAGSFRAGTLFRSYSGRLDWEVNPQHSAFMKFFQQYPNFAYSAGGGNAAAFSSTDAGYQGWTWAGGDTWLISPHLVNQFTAQVAQSYQTSLPSKFNSPSAAVLAAANIPASDIPLGQKATPGGSTVYSFPSFSWGSYPSIEYHAFYQEAVDTLTYTRNRHTFKFGADVLNQPRKLQQIGNVLGSFKFSKDVVFDPNNSNFNWASLTAAVPTTFTASTPTIPYQNQNLVSSLYTQDEWKLRPNLTVNLGMRWDLQTGVFQNQLHASLYPVPLPYVTFGGHHVYDNFGPRFGIAWDPWSDGKTAFRASYGILYTMLSNNTYENELFALRQQNVTVTNPTYPDPYSGKTFAQFVSTAPQAFGVNSNNVSNPPLNTASIGVTRQLGKDLALIVDGYDSKITKVQVTANVNTPAESAPGVVVAKGVRPLPQFGNISQVRPTGNYEDKALAVRLDKRFSHHYQYTISYTLAKQRDNYVGGASGGGSITDYNYPQEDIGWGATDRRNTLVASGSTRLPFGITFGGIFTFRSAEPLSATTGVDYLGISSTNGYVPGTTKNLHNKATLLAGVNTWRAANLTGANALPLSLSQIQSNVYRQFDARIAKDIRLTERYKLQLIGQLFNVLGTDNYGGVGTSQTTTANSGSFGAITSALPRQQGELAIQFAF